MYKNRTVLRPFWRRTVALWRIQCCNRMFARPLPQPRGAASSRVSSKFCHQKKTYFNSSIKSRRHHKSSCVKSRLVDNSLFSSALFRLLSVKIWSPLGCALQKMMTPVSLLTIAPMVTIADALNSSRFASHVQRQCDTPPRRSYK